MKTSYFLRGSGGQGVQVVGTMMLYAMSELGGYATFFPEYGSSKRGGFSQCAVVTGDEPIRSFTFKQFDVVILLNEDSYNKHKNSVKEAGTLIVNSSLIKNVDQSAANKVIELPVNEISEALGSTKVMNTLLFWFLARYMNLLTLEQADSIVSAATGGKEAFRELNHNALKAGFAEAEKFISEQGEKADGKN